MNINRIKNETLRKLTWMEIGELDLNNYGVFTYHGELKARKKGFKTEVINEWQTNFVKSDYRIEFVKIEQTDEDANYAMRIFDTERETYITQVNMLLGCEFFK